MKPFPSVKRIFFKFWWDQDLDELKSRPVVSCNIWKAASHPRSGPIFRNYRRDKSAYRYGIRGKRISDTEVYTNELHEALVESRVLHFGNVGKVNLNRGDNLLY